MISTYTAVCQWSADSRSTKVVRADKDVTASGNNYSMLGWVGIRIEEDIKTGMDCTSCIEQSYMHY